MNKQRYQRYQRCQRYGRTFAILLAWSACSAKTGTPKKKELTVFAAASLTDAFQAIAKDFEKSHPKIKVLLNFSGSQSLRTQIQNGAQPQVFASANAQHMEVLKKQGLVDEPVIFATNKLALVVPKTNPAGLKTLEDLPKAEKLVLASKNVPAGAYSEQVLASAAKAYGEQFGIQVQAHVVSRENHVRQTLQKVVLGEADAAIVYATDATSAKDKIITIPIPAEHNVVASYPVATIPDSTNAFIGTRFIEFLRSDTGRKRLAEFGFGPAP